MQRNVTKLAEKFLIRLRNRIFPQLEVGRLKQETESHTEVPSATGEIIAIESGRGEGQIDDAGELSHKSPVFQTAVVISLSLIIAGNVAQISKEI